MLKEMLKKINNKYVRLVALILVAVNSGAMMMGYQILPFSNEEIVAGVSIASMVAIEIWNHYKNNNYSPAAKEAQKVIDNLKAENK